MVECIKNLQEVFCPKNTNKEPLNRSSVQGIPLKCLMSTEGLSEVFLLKKKHLKDIPTMRKKLKCVLSIEYL